VLAPEVGSNLRRGENRVATTMERVAGETNAVFVDPAVQGVLDDSSLFLDSSHLNERGHARFAAFLEPTVKELMGE